MTLVITLACNSICICVSLKLNIRKLFVLFTSSFNDTSEKLWLQKRHSLKTRAHPLISQRGFQSGVKRSSGKISRIAGGDRVAVKVGVVQVEKVNDT